MKKLLAFLIIFLLVLGCSPKYAYFTSETTCPQCLVDSLLPGSNYKDWVHFEVVGINQGDSTLITTYVAVPDTLRTVSVVEYENSESSTVKEVKKIK